MVADLSLVNRYRRMVGRGMEQWDTDSGKTHAGSGGFTLCGWRIGDIRGGWEVSQYSFRENAVNCSHCLTQLRKMDNLY